MKLMRINPGQWALRLFCGLAFLFLIAPILVIIPLSFNAEPYFTFTRGMLELDQDAYSLRWYEQVIFGEQWQNAALNSLIIGVSATVLATVLGTLAALGLSSPALPGRRPLTALLISPLIVPIVISAAGMFFFYSSLNLTQTYTALILSHAALGAPFVVITVTASMGRFQPRTAAGGGQPRGRTGAQLLQGPVAHHQPGRHFRRPVRVCRRRWTKWWSCCSWAASNSAPSPGRCGPAYAKRSVRPSWRRRHS